MNENKKNLFMQAGVLAGAGIISRIIGLLYKSPLTAIIGDEGNGYYNGAYYIYSILLLISSYSIPSALSKIMAQRLVVKDYRNAHRIFRCALVYCLVVGGAMSLLAFFGAGLFVMGNSIPVLRTFAPVIFIFGPLGVLRGYFQAQGSMVQTSLSQIIEQLINAIMSITAANLMIHAVRERDTTTRAIHGAMGSALGTGCGVAIALIFMFGLYRLNQNYIHQRLERDPHPAEEYGALFKEIFFFVTPFILSTFIYNCAMVFDQTIFMKIMSQVRHFTEEDLAKAYGVFSGKAVVVSNIPIALASAVSSALMPRLSGLYSQGKKEESARLVENIIRTTMLVAIPCAFGLLFLAKPVMMLLYPQKVSLDEASVLLFFLAISVIFYSVSTISNSVLQGIGRVNAPVLNAAVSVLTQAGFLVVLLLFTDLGNMALVLAIDLYSFLMCLLNQIAVHYYLGARLQFFKTYLLPGLCAAIMGGAAYGIYQGLHALISLYNNWEYGVNVLSLVITIAAAVLIYGFLLQKLKLFTIKELRSIRKG